MSEKLGFSGFDGMKPDMTPVKRRRELLASALPDPFDLSAITGENGEIDPELRSSELYALSGIIIERLWEHLRVQPRTCTR